MSCPNCGGIIPEGRMFCPECLDAGFVLTCPNCKAELPEDAESCDKCGPGPWFTQPNQDYGELEAKMRPGMLSQTGFLGWNESLEATLKEDEETVRGLGLTHEQIARAIEVLFEKSKKGFWSNGRLVTRATYYKGWQVCPWGCKEKADRTAFQYSTMDLKVTNIISKFESLTLPGLIIHLIRAHHFYEGKNCHYRVDPAKVARILEIKPRKSLQSASRASQSTS